VTAASKTTGPADQASAGTENEPPGRLASLDGLRGVAALVVLIHHVVRVFPALGASHLELGALRPWSVGRFLLVTPLHLVWAGGEAVLVFFVLSGFVLAWPLANGRTPSWPRWYLKRFLRLYVPVWAALAVGAVSVTLFVAHDPLTGVSEFLRDRPPISFHGLILDASLVAGAGANAFERGAGAVTPVLWSLQWEVLFSAALPIYASVADRARRFPLPLAAVALLLVASTDGWAHYLPMFMLGVLLAFHRHAIRAWADRVDRTPRGGQLWYLLAAASAVLLLAHWWVPGLTGTLPGSFRLRMLIDAIALVGAVGVVVVALEWRPARRQLARRSCLWLGSRSFSLYLVHDPVVVALAHVFGGTPDPALLFVPLAIGASLGLAEAFHRAIERPSRRLANAVC
jgi:peptidoglycan/LPS O-acetylase OafA/YrhL